MFSIKNPRPWRNGRILRKGKCKTCSGLWNILLQGTYTTLDEINRLILSKKKIAYSVIQHRYYKIKIFFSSRV